MNLSFFVGGVIGSAILLLGYHFIFNKVNYKLWIFTLLVAGVCAGVIIATVPFDVAVTKEPRLLYIIWQTLVTGLLAVSIKTSNVKA